MTFAGAELFSNVHVLQGAPSSISTDGSNRYISGINGGRLEVYINSTVHTYEDVPTAGNFAGTMLTDGTFYSAYTDSTNTIKVIYNQIP